MKLIFFNQSHLDTFNRAGADVSDTFTDAQLGQVITLDESSEQDAELIARLEEYEHWELSKFECEGW